MENEELRQQIIEKFVLTEEQTLRNLEKIVDTVNGLVQYNDQTKNFEFNSQKEFSNEKKIGLFLVGLWTLNKLMPSKHETSKSKSAELSKKIGIPQTTLSAPLGNLVKKGFVHVEDGLYEFNHAKIEEFLKEF